MRMIDRFIVRYLATPITAVMIPVGIHAIPIARNQPSAEKFTIVTPAISSATAARKYESSVLSLASTVRSIASSSRNIRSSAQYFEYRSSFIVLLDITIYLSDLQLFSILMFSILISDFLRAAASISGGIIELPEGFFSYSARLQLPPPVSVYRPQGASSRESDFP